MSQKQVSLKKHKGNTQGENKTLTHHTHTHTPHTHSLCTTPQVVCTVFYCIAQWDSYLNQFDNSKKKKKNKDHTVLYRHHIPEEKNSFSLRHFPPPLITTRIEG
jgi:hypothetical protein